MIPARAHGWLTSSFWMRSVLNGLAAVALCTWLVAQATHIHTPRDSAKPAELVHHCDFCALLAAGAPAPAAVAVIPHLTAVCPSWPAAAPARIAQLALAYRSRAPPIA